MTESEGRRRRTRAEARLETRDAILSAARRLFAERGYRGASLDEIAEVAGFSKGAVYSNWPSKEALFLELLDAARPERPMDGLSTQPTGWALATLDFFIEAVRNPETRALLLYRGRERILRHGVLGLPCEDFLRDLIPGRPLGSTADSLGRNISIKD